MLTLDTGPDRDVTTASSTVPVDTHRSGWSSWFIAPAVDWSAWARGLGAEAPFAEVVVRQPDFLRGLSTALDTVDLATWQDWLRLRIVQAHAAYLGSDVVAAEFDFVGRTLSGIPEQRARWKRGVSLVDDSLGEAVGELYVARHFPPAARERMGELVDNLVEAFRRSFAASDWMSEETKAEAVAKLEAFTPKIGHPQSWRDYSQLEIAADALRLPPWDSKIATYLFLGGLAGGSAILALGAHLTELTKEQAEYIGVDVAGPFKPEHYRY